MTDKYSQKINEQIEGQNEQLDDIAHESLVAFLKQNKPIAPPCAPNFEQQLFAAISEYPQRSPSGISILRSWAWLVPVIVAAGLGLTWNFSRSQYQTASKPTNSIATISESEQAAIEQSLINSWSMNEDPTLTATSVSTDNQLLYELAPLEYE